MEKNIRCFDQDRAERADVRSALYGLAALLFNEIPNTAFVRRVTEGSFLQALEGFAHDGDSEPALAQACDLMFAYLSRAASNDDTVVSAELGVDRTRLYRGIAPGYGPMPPYEALWCGDGLERVQDVLIRVGCSYEQGGMQVASTAHERSDYAGIELAFCQYLVESEAAAWRAGNKACAWMYLSELQGFLMQLQAWLPVFVSAALPEASTDLYRGHLNLIQALLASECLYIAVLLDTAA